eukprot:CAMPEP_0167751680 /NCGR_PEP_ID=MMETSP0110_2-20121227/6717_1 /TAXON_ID=629695 /ORGANISM="Gymnochlora sp., Strain CCMP2014" /LENGTH=499 /DNA_ID=CAMNT_0007637211 /DNA_START=664 /DNA_END=2163 /DNA_ORIENTATION=+
MAATDTTPLMDSSYKEDFGKAFAEKKRMNAGWSILPSFILQTFVIFPFWLFFVLPCTIIYQAILKLFSLCSKKPPRYDPFAQVQTEAVRDRPKMEDREYDFIVMGATGFTGKLVVEYITVQYGTKKYKWAMAGRSIGKLEAVKKSLSQMNPEVAEVPLLVANSLDSKKMDELASKTRLVMAAVGPFLKYGTPLVAACARYGTHYCDITGEVTWVRHVIDKLDATARQTGARIVPLCGHDSVPWDMCAYAAAKEFEKKGDNLVSLKFYDEIRGQMSGGTLATATLLVNPSLRLARTKAPFNPMSMDAKGGEAPNKLKTRFPRCCSYDSKYGEFVGPFIMAPVNANVVKRSNALLGYSPSITYSEVITHPGCMSAWLIELQKIFIGTGIFFPPWKFFHSFCLPSPGEGPSYAERAAGYLKIKAFARSSKGNRLLIRFGLTVDPGYEDTARLLVECGLCTLSESITKQGKSGVLTPACAFGMDIIDRIKSQGRGGHFSVTAL